MGAIDVDGLRIRGALCYLVARLLKRAHHDLTIDEVLRAPKADKSYFLHLKNKR